jgi:diadenosine tetraphosphate (Ap4A) HIT family hydrolase
MTDLNRTTKCVFCTLSDSRIILANEHAIIIRDGFPISPGHTLVIPRRHVGSFFQITSEERACLLELLDQSKKMADEEFSPDGYNIGINDGASADQIVPHLHIHLIPRYVGDREDSRGGIRWIIPEKAEYWSRK